MIVRYPLGLRTIVNASKVRQSPANASLAMPRRGIGYVRPLLNNPPDEWDIALAFDAREKQVFMAWFLSPSYCDRGRNPFKIQIRMESGIVEKTVQFLPDGLLPANQAGECMTYTARVREYIE